MKDRKKILIVDDEQDVLRYLTAVLKNNDYMTYSADNARSGFHLLAEVRPDLVCLDIMMPRESGISLYAKMKRNKRFKNIPVLIRSGVVQEEEYDSTIFYLFMFDSTTCCYGCSR